MSRDNRKPTQAREISIETNVNLHAEGSVLVKFGNTHVICTASIDNNVPRWMKGSDKGPCLIPSSILGHCYQYLQYKLHVYYQT